MLEKLKKFFGTKMGIRVKFERVTSKKQRSLISIGGIVLFLFFSIMEERLGVIGSAAFLGVLIAFIVLFIIGQDKKDKQYTLSSVFTKPTDDVGNSKKSLRWTLIVIIVVLIGLSIIFDWFTIILWVILLAINVWSHWFKFYRKESKKS